MRGRTTRPFGLGDALLLLAAAAVALAGIRYQAERLELTVAKLWPTFFGSPWSHLRIAAPRGAELAMPALLSASAAVLLCRLRAPRPRRRRLWCQPGFLACLAGWAPFAWTFVLTFAVILRATTPAPPPAPPGDVGFGGPLLGWGDLPGEVLSVPPVYAAPAILLVWLVTWAGRRCRPEPSWIDRAGRVVGVLWVLLSLLIALDKVESVGIGMEPDTFIE